MNNGGEEQGEKKVTRRRGKIPVRKGRRVAEAKDD
jgi:hypothetical protein